MAVVQTGALWASFKRNTGKEGEEGIDFSFQGDFFRSLYPLKTNNNLNYIYVFISYLAVATLQIDYKKPFKLKVYREIIATYSNPPKHTV